jgi:hypothetical protein
MPGAQLSLQPPQTRRLQAEIERLKSRPAKLPGL